MRIIQIFMALVLSSSSLLASTTTWDGKHSTASIDVTVVYFVPSDREPLPDWRARVDYFCKRIEQFHRREFGDQSMMKTMVHSEPLISEATTELLRVGDADAIYYRTLGEADRRLKFATTPRTAFPILLVLSDINWRPLDDFFRLRRTSEGRLEFEGNLNKGQHFPGAAAGGARAAYLADRGVGWGLVSADGWRVPYRGSDCVIYHEGCGHTVGLPHPEPGNGSVMSLGQYHGWISESWLDKEQKTHLGWQPEDSTNDPQMRLFSQFRAIPEPMVPQPDQRVKLNLDWPPQAKVQSLRVRIQTSLGSPWIDVPQAWDGDAPASVDLGTFDRATPISYRVDATLIDGETAEIWGYLQVRRDPNQNPMPLTRSIDLIPPGISSDAAEPVANPPKTQTDLLSEIDLTKRWQRGDWVMRNGRLESPKQYGARIELPYEPAGEYRLTVIVEPLDEPNGLILGQCSEEHRFVTLLNFRSEDVVSSAIENIDGRNVGNESTFSGTLFQKHRLSQVVVTVRESEVRMEVDGRRIVAWQGNRNRLSLGDYWQTPNRKALFLGAYDCRYRFYRVSVEPL